MLFNQHCFFQPQVSLVDISVGSAKRDVDSSFHFVSGSRPSISIVRTRELNACQHALIETCIRFLFPFSETKHRTNGKHSNLPKYLGRSIKVDNDFVCLRKVDKPCCRFPLQGRVRDRYFEIESGNETRRPIFGTSTSLIIASVDYSLNYPMWGSIDWPKSNYTTLIGQLVF